MSTSLLYHGFGISGYRYVRTNYREGGVIFTITRKKFSVRCPVSDALCVKVKILYVMVHFPDGYGASLLAKRRHT